MTKKELMIKAHNMTKEIKNEFPEVDYQAQLGLCLAYICEAEKEEVVVEATREEKILALGYKVWEKKNAEGVTFLKRIYINNLMEFAEKINHDLSHAICYKKDSMYLDCLDGKFYFNVQKTKNNAVSKLIDTLDAM